MTDKRERYGPVQAKTCNHATIDTDSIPSPLALSSKKIYIYSTPYAIPSKNPLQPFPKQKETELKNQRGFHTPRRRALTAS